MDEAVLLKNAWSSEAGISDLVQEHRGLFYRLAFRILQDSQRAEDACQQALMKAWERRGEVSQGSLRSWVARVVVTESLQMVRRSRIERRVIAGIPAGRSRNVAEQVVLRETLLEAIGDLPEDQQQVVVLRLVMGMTGREVAAAMGWSDSDVSRCLHAGLARMRVVLQDEKGQMP